MKTLITGAPGFVGSAVLRQLLKAGHDVRVLVLTSSDRRNIAGLPVEIVHCDLNDRPSLDRALGGCQTLFRAAEFFVRFQISPTYRLKFQPFKTPDITYVREVKTMNNLTERTILDLMSYFLPPLSGMTGTTTGALLAAAWKPCRSAKRILRIAVIGLALAFAIASPVSAEQGTQVPTTQPVSQISGKGAAQGPALVVFHNRLIVIFRSSMWGYSPQERARSVQGTIKNALSVQRHGQRHGCQAYTVDREPQKQISKIVSDLDLSTV